MPPLPRQTPPNQSSAAADPSDVTTHLTSREARRYTLTPRNTRALIVVFAALLTLRTVAALSPILDLSFVADDWFLIEAARNDGPLVPAGGDSAQFYRPVTQLVFAAFDAAGALTPGDLHAFSLAVHVTCTLLLALLTRHLAGLTTALFAAAFFSTFPGPVEAVAWVAALSDLLAAAFTLVTLLALERYLARPCHTRAALVFAFTFLAVASKESALALPLAIAARLSLLAPIRAWRTLHRTPLFTTPIIASTLAVALFAALRFIMLGHIGGYHGMFAVSSGGALVRYLTAPARTLLSPADPGFAAALPVAIALTAIVVTALLGRAIIVSWRARDADRPNATSATASAMSPAVALTFAYLSLGAAIPFGVVGTASPEGGRYLYLPSLVVALGLGIAFRVLLGRAATGHAPTARTLARPGVATLLALALLTLHRDQTRKALDEFTAASELSQRLVFAASPLAAHDGRSTACVLATPDSLRHLIVARTGLASAVRVIHGGYAHVEQLVSTRLTNADARIATTREGTDSFHLTLLGDAEGSLVTGGSRAVTPTRETRCAASARVTPIERDEVLVTFDNLDENTDIVVFNGTSFDCLVGPRCAARPAAPAPNR